LLTCQMNNGRSIDIYEGSQLLTTYHVDSRRLKNYFHPVNTGEGYPLTLDQPYDHPWHHGLYFTWKYINGINFWEDTGSPDETGRMTNIGEPQVWMESGKCNIQQMLIWEVLTGEKFMDEHRNITIHPIAQNGGYRIDFDLSFKSLKQTLHFDRTSPEEFPWGGYAGLSFRPVRSFGGGTLISSEDGHDVTSVHGKAAKWCDFTGRLDGGRELSGGISIFDHPGNPRHPSPYYVFDTNDLQFLQPALLFNEPLYLDKSQILRLRYGVYIHQGAVSKTQVEDQYQQYVRTSTEG
jgi:hypothetical protein